MLSFGSLWLPVVLSAVAAWILSAISWMALPLHKKDWGQVPDEDGLMEAVGKLGLATGQYSVPHCGDHSKMKDPAFQAKLAKGPVFTLTVVPSGMPSMGKALGLWIGYLLLAGFITAYVARHALAPGAACVDVMRVTTTVLFGIHVLSQVPPSIWMGRPWRATFMQMVDGVAYSLAGGAIFCWLWPAA